MVATRAYGKGYPKLPQASCPVQYAPDEEMLAPCARGPAHDDGSVLGHGRDAAEMVEGRYW